MPRKLKLAKAKNNHAYQNRLIDKTKKKTKSLPELQKRKPELIKDTDAGKIWSRISSYLRKSDMVKNVDLTTIVMLCTEIEVFHKAYRDIQNNGIQQPIYDYLQNAKGEIIKVVPMGFKKNPAVNTMDAAVGKVRGLCSDLGLTPESRAKLISLASDDDDDGPNLKEMLTGGTDF